MMQFPNLVLIWISPIPSTFKTLSSLYLTSLLNVSSNFVNKFRSPVMRLLQQLSRNRRIHDFFLNLQDHKRCILHESYSCGKNVGPFRCKTYSPNSWDVFILFAIVASYGSSLFCVLRFVSYDSRGIAMVTMIGL